MLTYLEFPGLESFLAEAKRRNIGVVGLVEASMRHEVFEQRLFRLTAYDRSEGLILRCDLAFYNGFQIDQNTPKQELEKYGEARGRIEGEIRRQLEVLNLRVVEAEYHP
jgi:hypothetical protein